jgi:riboflavin kinase / FMN adenylyltransferase
MRILHYAGEALPEAKGAVVALGNFDGVHRGHRALIGEARQIARTSGAKLGALVFEPYPREFFRPGDEAFRLTPLRTKAQLLARCGVDILIVLSFDDIMAGRLAQDFVIDILLRDLAVAHVVAGEDFRFGKNRGGDATVLAYMGDMEGFGVDIVAAVTEGGEKISSSQVRAALKAGRVAEAAQALGHYWAVEAPVLPGDRRGRELGFPTANLKLDNTLAPAFGVYAVRVRRENGTRLYDGVANFGLRPMFALAEPLLEVHVFDFSGDLYGEVLSVEWIAYLRGEENFASLDDLKAQIRRDCDAARSALAAAPTPPL